MAYSELIKNFEKIRDYMREFYVYGFRTRSEFNKKSARSYDNERRRVESWLGDYMSFHQDASGKSIYISVDNRTVPRNPLHNAWKAKSFTDMDITLHFILLDLLEEDDLLPFREIVERISDIMMAAGCVRLPDESTIRNKLKEYCDLGLIRSEKVGRELRYGLNSSQWDREGWKEALAFASETMPAGSVGSFLLDKYETTPEHFSFKHHYLFGTMDDEILCQLLECRRQGRKCDVTIRTKRTEGERIYTVFPLKVYISTENGREYLYAYQYHAGRPTMYRLDHIRKVKMLDEGVGRETMEQTGEMRAKYLWGISTAPMVQESPDRLEFTVTAAPEEYFIPQRLEREKRNGYVEQVDEKHWKYTAWISDALELLPWLRTFTGRITELKCTNRELLDRWERDLAAMKSMYGGDTSDVS